LSEMIREHKWSLSNHGSKKTNVSPTGSSSVYKSNRKSSVFGQTKETDMTEPKQTTTAKNKTTTDEQNGRQRHRTDSTPRDKLHRSAIVPNNKNEQQQQRSKGREVPVGRRIIHQYV
jgi:hypothetical protein